MKSSGPVVLEPTRTDLSLTTMPDDTKGTPPFSVPLSISFSPRTSDTLESSSSLAIGCTSAPELFAATTAPTWWKPAMLMRSTCTFNTSLTWDSSEGPSRSDATAPLSLAARRLPTAVILERKRSTTLPGIAFLRTDSSSSSAVQLTNIPYLFITRRGPMSLVPAIETPSGEHPISPARRFPFSAGTSVGSRRNSPSALA